MRLQCKKGAGDMELEFAELQEWTQTSGSESGTPIGFGIAPGGDDTAAILQISNAIHKADHEARGIPEIVSKGRPKRCARRNRIARANKLGAALRYARLTARRQSCDAASSACNIGNGSVAKPRREIRKSSRRWEWVGPLSTGALERGAIRVLIGQSACLTSLRSVRRGSGVKIG